MKSPKTSLTIWSLVILLMGGVACTTPNAAPSAPESPTAATESALPTTAATEATVIEETVTEESPTMSAPTATTQAFVPQLEPEATATPTPAPTAPPPTPILTSDVVAGWLTYENEYFGYQFAYPPDARIRTHGVTGFPTDELPENVTSEEYRRQLEETYPDDLCVTVQYEEGFVVFVPASERERLYSVPCGVTGVGDYEIIGVSETVLIDGIPVEASGSQLHGCDGVWRGEFFFLDVSDTVTIHYGSMEGSRVMNITDEEYLSLKETLLQIVTSFRQY